MALFITAVEERGGGGHSGISPLTINYLYVFDMCISKADLMVIGSLVPRPSITANAVEGLVKLLHRGTFGRCWEAWHFW